jgi:hypothetical protein
MNEEVLSAEDRSHIIRQFIRNLVYSRYNVEISLIAENAVSSPNQNNIDSFSMQLQEADEKIAALQEELAEVEAELATIEGV